MNRILSMNLLIIILVGWYTASAQVELGAQLRPRAEYRHGFKTPIADGQDAAFFTEQRSRVLMAYTKNQLKVGLSVQDVRIWGETGQINKSDGLTSFHEAYAEYALAEGFSVKLGRQELNYDDARILGNLDWAAQARSHDALVFSYTDSLWSLHTGAAYNQNSSPPEPSKLTDNFYQTTASFAVPGGGLPNPKQLYYLWWQHSAGKLRYSLLALGTGWQVQSDSSVNFMWTLGANPEYRISDKMKVFLSFYYQFGKDRLDNTVDAMLASANFSCLLSPGVTMTIGGDYVSGNRQDATAGTTGAFDPLFGTHHKFYGYMDYFYVGSPHGNVGLINPYIKTSVKLSSKSQLAIDLHQFMAAVPVADPSDAATKLSSSIGQEIDLTYTLKLSPGVVVTGGYSHMLYTSTMEAIKSVDTGRTANWAYLMLSFNPGMFKL